MANTGLSCIFPAFVSDYCDDAHSFITNYNDRFSQYLKLASSISGLDLTSFDIANNNFLDNELKSQLIAYIISCCVSDIIKENDINANYVAGYSMGIYAAFYHTKVYSFEVGLGIIQTAFEIIASYTGDIKFGMATIAGLDENDLIDIFHKCKSDAEIINENSRYNFVISGKLDEIKQIVHQATQEGALLAYVLPVTVPYHSRHMKNAADKFAQYIESLKLQDSHIPYISSIDQRLVLNLHDIKKELINNIRNKINWHRTMLKLVEFNAQVMLECGVGKSLYKMSKFIEGDIKVYPISKLSNFIGKIF